MSIGESQAHHQDVQHIRGKKDIDIDVHRICRCGNAVGKSLSTAATLP